MRSIDTAARPLFVYVLQCLVTYSMDHRAESHSACSAASVESKYGQWRRSFACSRDASYLHSRISLVSFMTTRSVRALEDHVAWFSRTSLVTLMSGARVSSSCLCIRHTLASESLALFHVSRSSVSVVLRFLFQHPLSALTYSP